MSQLLTVRDVARLCQVHEVTVRRHIASGRIRSVRIGRGVRVRREDLDAYLEGSEPSGEVVVPREGGPLRPDDPIFGLVGLFSDESWVSAEKHRVLADTKQ